MRLLAATMLLGFPLAVSAEPAPSQIVTGTSQPAAQPAPDDHDEAPIVVEGERPKPICEIRRETGSITPRRICRTPEQVEADSEQAAFVKTKMARDAAAAELARELGQH